MVGIHLYMAYFGTFVGIYPDTKIFLQALLDLNYNKFVRVGSLKKVARRVLPFTAQSSSARTGEGTNLDLDNTSVGDYVAHTHPNLASRVVLYRCQGAAGDVKR